VHKCKIAVASIFSFNKELNVEMATFKCTIVGGFICPDQGIGKKKRG
jgi:hypothetical protein